MTPRQLRWLTDCIALVSLVLLVGAEWMVYSLPENRMGLRELAVSELGSGSLPFVLGFGGVGWLLARRLPGNAVGWSFAVGGLMWAAGAAGGAWGALAAAGSGEVSGLARIVTNLGAFIWLFSMPLSVQLPLLLLPNGRLLSSRWRQAVVVLGAGVFLGALGFATKPGVIEGTDPARHLVNPLGVRWLGPVPLILGVTGAGLLLVVMLAGAVAVVLRFRRSRGVERQQMRWVAAGGSCVLIAPLVALTPGLPDTVDGIAGSLAILAIPVCVGVAVLRYHLYDLGRVVSRTLSYAVVTAVLVGLYVAGSPAPRGSRRATPRSPSPPRRWPLRRCSSPCAAGCRARWTTGSTARATTRTTPSTPSPAGCGTKSTSTRCGPTCYRSCTGQCSRPRPGSGSVRCIDEP